MAQLRPFPDRVDHRSGRVLDEDDAFDAVHGFVARHLGEG